MSSISFSRGETPYENREALLDDYTPKELVGRNEELQEYKSLLSPVIWGDQPNNIFLYGKAGVGKTAATRYMLAQLQRDAEQYDDISLTTIHLNCDGLESSYQVAVKLINTLRVSEDHISESGYSKSEVYEMMWTELDRQNSIILLVLDEVDHVHKDDSILYQLSRARENGKIQNVRIGLIGISNDMTFRERLSAKVKSSLCEREISFSDYDANELRQVLQQREKVAFKENAVEDDVIPYCAALAARETGDAREALDYLLSAGDIAREENKEVVTREHLNRGKNKVERKAIARGLADRGDHVRYIAYAIATLDAEDTTPVRSSEIYSRYKQIVKQTPEEALSTRWVREHLDSLTMIGILQSKELNKGAQGGRYKEYRLNQSPELVVDALGETISTVGVHSSISEYV